MGTGASGSPQPVIAIHLQSGDWLSLYDSYLAIGMQSIWLHDVIGSGVGTAPLATPPGSATSIILGTRNGYRYVLTPTAPDQATAFLDALYRLRPD